MPTAPPGAKLAVMDESPADAAPAVVRHRFGHLTLSTEAEAGTKPQEVLVPLAPVAEEIGSWLAAGALCAAQAMAPVAAMAPEVRARIAFLGEGPGVGLAAWIALHLGCGRVEAVLHPSERAVVDAAVAAAGKDEAWFGLSRIDEAEDGAFFHMVAYGCDGRLPEDLTAAAPLVKRMRPEGQLLLFGLPAARLEDAFDGAAKRGLSLRAMGVQEELAFFAGSLEHRHDFR